MDNLGQWSYQYLSCKNNQCLVIILAYQVCDQQIRVNGRVKLKTAYAQQTQVLEIQDRHIKPRKAFIHDLDKFIGNIRAEGNGVLLLGDFNEELYYNNCGMKKIQSNNQLVDILWKECAVDQFSTSLNGSKRIDYILCDHWVSNCVVAACCKPFKLQNKGDHCTMLVDFDSRRLFGNPTYKIVNPMQRNFQSKDKSSVQLYLNARDDYLVEHNFHSVLLHYCENRLPNLLKH